jgi:hypothetical protein
MTVTTAYTYTYIYTYIHTYIHVFQAFDTDEDMPSYDCDDGLEPEGEKSAHHMCGQLKKMVKEEEVGVPVCMHTCMYDHTQTHV